MTTWTSFLKKHAGKGYTREELSKMYQKKYASKIRGREEKMKKSAELRRKPRKYSRKVCQEIVSAKIRVNMDEYKKGRYTSPQQAIAVSYSQVQKRYPKCNRYLKRSK